MASNRTQNAAARCMAVAGDTTGAPPGNDEATTRASPIFVIITHGSHIRRAARCVTCIPNVANPMDTFRMPIDRTAADIAGVYINPCVAEARAGSAIAVTPSTTIPPATSAVPNELKAFVTASLPLRIGVLGYATACCRDRAGVSD